MTIKVKIVTEPWSLVKEERAAFRTRAKAAVREAADLVLKDIKRRLSLRRGPAPAPEGEPPALQTGKLLRSYRRLPARIKGDVASSGIISKDPGANRVEFGTTDSRGVRTLPHPAVRPAFAAMETPVTELLTERLGGTAS